MASSPLATTRNKLIFLGCWLLWSAVQLITLLEWDFPWTIALGDALITSIVLGFKSWLVINNLRYYRPRKGKYVYILVMCAALSGLGMAAVKYSLHAIFRDQPDYLLFLDRSMFVRFDIAFLITGCVALMSELWYTLDDQQEQEIRKADAERLARDAELFRLRQQLQPHFLFNSLNSISALVTLQPTQARKMIQQLSDFLRGTLRKDEQQWISLEEELQHLQLYLEIEKVRFGHRLNTEIVQGPEAGKFMIPHMLLQPVVENAIKFGLYDTTDAITIRVSALVIDHYLVISISNPYDPETSSPRQGTGFGLHSAQRRLYLLYARNDLLTTQTDQNIFTTTIKLPQA